MQVNIVCILYFLFFQIQVDGNVLRQRKVDSYDDLLFFDDEYDNFSNTITVNESKIINSTDTDGNIYDEYDDNYDDDDDIEYKYKPYRNKNNESSYSNTLENVKQLMDKDALTKYETQVIYDFFAKFYNLFTYFKQFQNRTYYYFVDTYKFNETNFTYWRGKLNNDYDDDDDDRNKNISNVNIYNDDDDYDNYIKSKNDDYYNNNSYSRETVKQLMDRDALTIYDVEVISNFFSKFYALFTYFTQVKNSTYSYFGNQSKF